MGFKGVHSTPSIWINKGKSCWEGLMLKYELGSLSLRKSIPYGQRNLHLEPERCLPWPGFSIGFLLVISLRSSLGANAKNGLVESGDTAKAFRRIFDALCDRLPQDSGSAPRGPGAGGRQGERAGR